MKTVIYGIYIILYTTFFTNPKGLGTGIWGGLEYWLQQHDVQRGGQPWYYYLLLLPLYEFLPLSLAIPAILYYLRRGSPFPRFLIYWIFGALIIYALAGEKMPWLSLNMALPITLLGGMFLGELVGHINWRETWDRGGGLFVLLLLILPFAIGSLFSFSPPPATEGIPWVYLIQRSFLAIALALLVLGMWDRGRALELKTSLAMGLVSLLLLLALLTVRSAWMASYYNGDIPVEMMVYTQTSPEVPRISKEIRSVAAATGEGDELKITVDATDGFTWPWAWYLRDYKNVDYPTLTKPGGPPSGSVLLLNANNQRALRPFLDKYDQGRPFPLRWWFPENYRELTPPRLLSFFGSPESLEKLWRYLIYRDTAPLGSADALAYFPKELSPLREASPVTPKQDEYTQKLLSIKSDLIIGRQGSAPGAFGGPKDIALDPQGNVYVVDSINHRVQKLSANGEFLAQVGGEGSAPGQFNDPWGIALDKQGNVYVADTWNHRIQKFDSSLKFIAEWGSFANTQGEAQENPSQFYGPRDIAIDAQDNLWVADTGNKRVQKFSPDGEFLAAHGGAGAEPGQLLEPVGIAIGPQEVIFVADTWNRRVQRFDKDFHYLGEFPIQGWPGQSPLNKPYLALDPQGNLLISDPENSRVLHFSPQGALLAVLDGGFSLPVGVAVDRAGRIYVADAESHRVLRFPALP